jgi:hypothetical protein
MTHTPGPWRLDNNIAYGWKTNPFSITVRKRGVHSTTVANIPAKQTISRDEAEANARLIAAAPDLLDALMTVPQGLLWSDDDLWRWHDKARAAIAKATGGEK